MKKPRPSAAFLSKKRARKLERWRQQHSALSQAQGSPPPWAGWPVGDYLSKLRKCAIEHPTAGRTVIHIPPTFSIIDAPEDALKAIGLVALAAGHADVKELRYDHRAVKEYDLAAEAVLDIVALDVGERRRISRWSMECNGALPNDPGANRFIRAIGITQYLGVRNMGLQTSEEEKLRRFYQSRRAPDPDARQPVNSEKAVVIAKFADQIDACLRTVGRQLTARGRAALCGYTGELIDNVEQHARSRDWYLSSYLDTSLCPPICEVAILNFGRTFAESFLQLSPESYPRAVVAPYLQTHERGGWFSPSWRAEDLLTLVALQGGISCKSVDGQDTRGQGTVDLIQFFQGVLAECNPRTEQKARMAILSGDTHIVFDGTYRMALDGHGREVLAFNPENSLAKPPDNRFVRHLRRGAFPGTVVSIRFPLEQTATLGEAK